jgi:hypothetical protein
MTIAITLLAQSLRLPRLILPRLFDPDARRRRQASIDLIKASPHLLRDIGATEEHVRVRRR